MFTYAQDTALPGTEMFLIFFAGKSQPIIKVITIRDCFKTQNRNKKY